ncbi:MAG: hypothetical protein D6796_06180 [Caldilineae bacterium]|nr:MAG: hypothetical protein D6796_06180 [Caldilineae bacterium]
MELIGFGNLKNEYYPRNGIAFAPDGGRQLFFEGQAVAQGVLPGTFRDKVQVRDYFYNLRFLEDFPQVTHWAFGDAWTQQVLIHRPKKDGDALWGMMHFASEEDTGQYVIERSFEMPPAPYITVPMPTNFSVPINFPLKLVLAQLLLQALDDNAAYDRWYFVTSLVERGDVPKVLPTDIRTAYGFRFKNTPTDLRAALCDWQGLRV